MLHERKFFFLASKAIVFTLSCVYGRSLFTGYLTNVINPTRVRVAAISADDGSDSEDVICLVGDANDDGDIAKSWPVDSAASAHMC